MKLFASLSKRSVDPDLSGRLIRLFRLTPYSLLLTLFSISPLLLCSPAAVYAQWGPEIRLTYDPSLSTTDQNNAWHVATSGENVHVVWSDRRASGGVYYEVWYKRSTDGGVSWSADISITVPDDDHSWFPAVGVSGPFVHIVWADARGDIMYRRSTNYGASWDSPPIELGISGVSRQPHPSMAVDGPFVHVVWEYWPDYWYAGICYIRSIDNGDHWGDGNYYDLGVEDMNPCVAVSGPYVHLVWDKASGSPGNYLSRVGYRRATDYGRVWEDEFPPLTSQQNLLYFPSLAASGQFVHAFYKKLSGNDIWYRRSTDNGGNSWETETQLSTGDFDSKYPNASCEGNAVHLVWQDARSSTWPWQIYYRHSPDNGAPGSWGAETPLSTYDGILGDSWWPSVAASNSIVHVVWSRYTGLLNPTEIYYKRNPAGTGYFGFKTDSTNGRHLVRDPSRGHLHMVMTGLDGYIYYARSSDDGATWPYYKKMINELNIRQGMYPTIGLAVLPEEVYPPKLAVCIAFNLSDAPYSLSYWYNNGYDDPGMGNWMGSYVIPAPASPVGTPSLVTIGTRVYVAYWAGDPPNRGIYCNNFEYNTPTVYVRDPVDVLGNPHQPSLAVDGNGEVYAAWKRGGPDSLCPAEWRGLGRHVAGGSD